MAEQSRKDRSGHSSIVEPIILPGSVKCLLTPDARDAIVMRRNAGESVKALSQEFAISESALRDLLVTADVEFRRHPITPEDSDHAVKLYESGLTIREVATKMGYSLGTIRHALHQRDEVIRPSGRWNHRPPKSK